MSDDRVRCPTCVQQLLRSTVHEGTSKSTAVYCPPFYDEEGRRHHHDANRRSRSFRCSNGHSWIDHKPNTCWCGWAQAETGFPPEAPTTGSGRPRAASMPDSIVASTPSEVPPAGYEVACTTDNDGFEFPVEPRTFSRIRPK